MIDDGGGSFISASSCSKGENAFEHQFRMSCVVGLFCLLLLSCSLHLLRRRSEPGVLEVKHAFSWIRNRCNLSVGIV